MWQNNGFGNNGQIPNSFNQDGYPLAHFGSNSGQSLPGQQYFSHQSNLPDLIQYEDTNGEGFQPEVGLYNDGSFIQNQFANSQVSVVARPVPRPESYVLTFLWGFLTNCSSAQFSPSHFNFPQPIIPNLPRPPTQINARAAELKAELLKRQKGRTSSATPPVLTVSAAKQTARHEGSRSLRESPNTPLTATETQSQELNLNELISQYSDSKPAAEASVKQENKPN